MASFVRSAHVPNVMTLTTEAVETMCLKNRLRLSDMLQYVYCVPFRGSSTVCLMHQQWHRRLLLMAGTAVASTRRVVHC